jgi:F-type H+-transporting ATPase subunit delta
MNESKISVRYAKALFLSARDKGLVERVREDMKYLLELSSYPDVRELLESPIIKKSIKRDALSALTNKRVDKLTTNLILLAVDNGRESSLAGISRSYIDEADRFNGITKASLTSASDMAAETVERIRTIIEKSTGTKVEMSQNIDSDITGGFLLKVEDQFIDGSVRTQLRKIKKEITEDK